MERAQRLVAQSGRAGERIVIWAGDFRRDVGRYFVGLLNDLGFHATLRLLRYDDGRLALSSSRAQAGFIGWGADHLSPSTFMQSLFTCAPPRDRHVENLSKLCNPTLERLIARARAVPPSDAGNAWAAADRRVTNLAAAVPMTNRRAVVLVSKRVGNVEQHGQWFTLLDQMWVR